MKKIIAAAVCVIMLILPLTACFMPAGQSQANTQLAEAMEKRRQFRESDLFGKMNEYVNKLIAEKADGLEFGVSVEPGTIDLTKLEDYAKFAEDEELRKKLFKETEIAARIFDTESKTVSREEVARFLLENLVSCKLMADNLGADYYEVDAEKGTCELVKVPEAN
ncbi:MAG: hypothetical protein IJU57_04740 [Clostridia bacterium]|nr:hypothetical protein [Clostridia bacterium]